MYSINNSMNIVALGIALLIAPGIAPL